jgi:hypothetical protein
MNDGTQPARAFDGRCQLARTRKANSTFQINSDSHINVPALSREVHLSSHVLSGPAAVRRRTTDLVVDKSGSTLARCVSQSVPRHSSGCPS